MNGTYVLLLALTASTSGAELPAFEVASIKEAPAQPGGGRITRLNWGPGTRDPGRISYLGVSLQQLVMLGWDVREDQAIGPGWLSSTQYNPEAKLPPETTKQSLSLMIRRLLIERFSLAAHEGKRSADGFALTVSRDGPKLAPGGKSQLNTTKNNPRKRRHLIR